MPYAPPYASLFGENWSGLPNSILSFHLFRESSLRGYNYASAACGILPESGSHLVRNFHTQLLHGLIHWLYSPCPFNKNLFYEIMEYLLVEKISSAVIFGVLYDAS